MDRTKYIGMDVHQASISIAVRDASGKRRGAAENTGSPQDNYSIPTGCRRCAVSTLTITMI